MAMVQTNTAPEILHSDQGSEYRSFLVLDFLMKQGIEPSMSKKWSPWENGWQESYYGKFKLELDHPHRYETVEILIEAIYKRIHYYNCERIHTAIKMPPKIFLKEFREKEEILLGNRMKKSTGNGGLREKNVVVKIVPEVKIGVS